MKILAFFLSGCEYGKVLRGAERRFFEVSTRLKNLGVEIFALEYESLHSEKWGQLGYTPIKIKQRFSSHAILSVLTAIIIGLMVCVKCKCDIIYVTCRFAFVGGSWTGLIAPYIVSCLCRKPLVIIFHHILPKDFKDKNTMRLGACRKATCIAVSKATANDVKKCFRAKNVIVVGNGVNWDFFRTANCKSKKYDAVFLGRVSEEKGIFNLLKSWKNVVGKISSAQLLLVGGISSKIEEKLYKTIRELQLKQNITVTGFVSDKKVAELLASSKIFVLPSLMEGFGLAVAEAMAAGLPCIISNLPALKENFHSTAVFVEPKNVDGLVQAILALLSDPEKRRRLKIRGQGLVKRFSWEAVTKKELEVLKSVLSSWDVKQNARS